MTKIMNSNQSHKSYMKYKSENGCTWTSEYQRWDKVPYLLYFKCKERSSCDTVSIYVSTYLVLLCCTVY
jgi:hypothetical protein